METARAAAIAAAARSRSVLTRAVGPAALRASHLTADYAQGGLVLAAVAFKLAEWWYGARRTPGPRHLPVPPPPPKLRPHPDGVGVPVMGACPLCGVAPMASPAMVVGSGCVFCHSCAVAHVRRRGTCPVTLARAAPEDRKLFSE